MGAKVCKLEIQVEQRVITAGDALTGRVVVQCEKIKHLPQRVALVFLGQELSHIQHLSDKFGRKYDAGTHSSRQICSSEVTLLRENEWSGSTSKTYVSCGSNSTKYFSSQITTNLLFLDTDQFRFTLSKSPPPRIYLRPSWYPNQNMNTAASSIL